MSTSEVLGLGAIAGATIFLGLPVGRLRGLTANSRVLLSSIATGILLFLLWDVLTHAVDPIEGSINDSDWTRFTGMALLFVVCTGVGLLSLVYYEKWFAARRAGSLVGPGAYSMDESRGPGVRLSAAANLSLLIALGIGMHNFSEGLAIGQSAAAGELSLAYALIIGFALHNATEGFGIIGPMAAEGELPGWGYLLVLGIVGGAPTFVGTAVGQAWTNDLVSVAFLALAAGSILFVVLELLRMNSASAMKHVLTWGLLGGLFAGFVTDWVLIAAGA